MIEMERKSASCGSSAPLDGAHLRPRRQVIAAGSSRRAQARALKTRGADAVYQMLTWCDGRSTSPP